MSAPAIGIDLGTTYSCVGVYRNERVEIIANAQGNRTTPSVVSFGKERLVGEPAKNQEAVNPENTIFGVKRLIGRKWNEGNVQNDIKEWPFKVVNEEDRPKIAVTHEGKERTFFPEEMSAMVLRCMKAAAEAHLGKAVRNAVVTVPAYFNDSQRQATRDAAAIAGLSVLRIINEPTAAALAYGLDQQAQEERNVLIFDLGGGTFDVSVLCIEDGIFEVRSTAGDTHLGGEDLDSRLTAHFAEEFKRRHRYDLTGNSKALRRLRTASERAKRMLSSASEATVELDSLHEGIDFLATVTRARFEELCDDLFRRTLEPMKQALADAKLNVKEISEIVLVGGSTRVPKVQALLREYFDGRELTQTVNPDEAVAAGAAVQAALLDGDASETVTDLVLLDITPLSLGTTVHGDIMSVIIPRNTPIPVKKTEKYQTVYDNQSSVSVEIREGERKISKDNNLLGKYSLNGLPRAPAGVTKVLTTFEIDTDGILHATSIIPGTNIKNNVFIEKGRLNKNQIQKLIEEAERFEQEDKIRKETAEAKSNLEAYCRNLCNRINNNLSLSSATVQTLQTHCEETLKWLEKYPQASKDEYRRKKRDLELLCELTNMRM